MRRISKIGRACCVLAAVLLFAAIAHADTIVLKNGRRIVAFNVVEIGNKVSYETSAGQLSIPKSIVDHIEKGGLMPMMDSPAAAAASLNLSAPAVDSMADASEIDKSAVHDNAIDLAYLARVEEEARSGGGKSAERAALAEHSAAQFMASRGDLIHALAYERKALNYAPEQPAFLLTIGYFYLRQSEFKQSLDYVEKARRISPNNVEVFKLAGWAYYGMNRPEQAVKEWKRAQEIHPESDVQAALEKAQRDKNEEENYKENESAHFELRYNGAAAPTLAREVLHVLEGHYAQIESELNYSPPEPIGVILYTQQAFADITSAPGWAGALNDGRIRVPVQGLSSVDPELSRVLRHELTHSFIQQKTHGRAPTWIQEGLAQWMEGKRSDQNAGVLLQVYQDGQAASLDRLEGPWMRLPEGVVRYAYAWSLANMEYIVQTGGMGDVQRILDRISVGSSAEEAVKSVLRDDYPELMQGTAEYLKKNYGR
jgi:tetratricopeptide (TPR) repeat protein